MELPLHGKSNGGKIAVRATLALKGELPIAGTNVTAIVKNACLIEVDTPLAHILMTDYGAAFGLYGFVHSNTLMFLPRHARPSMVALLSCFCCFNSLYGILCATAYCAARIFIPSISASSACGFGCKFYPKCRADPVRPWPEALDIARLARGAKPKGAVLFVNHIRGGGTERHAQDLAALLETTAEAFLLAVISLNGRDSSCRLRSQ